MTSVLALGVPAVPRVGGENGLGPHDVLVASLDVLRSTALLGELIDRVTTHLATPGSSVLVVHRETDAAEAQRLLGLLRATRDGARILAAGTSMPPVAAGVVARVCAAFTGPYGIPAAAAVAAVPWVEREMFAAAWLPSVTRLDHPGLTFGQHVSSLLPMTQFVAYVAPEPGIENVASDTLPRPLPAGLGERPVVVASGTADLPAWVAGPLLRALDPKTTARLPDDPEVARYWGSKRAVEVVAVPADLDEWAVSVAEEWPCIPCSWCGELRTAAGSCAWCGIAAPARAV